MTYPGSQYFVEGLGLVLEAKMCPDQPQTFNTVKNNQAFPKEQTFFFFFLNEPVPWTPRLVCIFFGANIRRIDRVRLV